MITLLSNLSRLATSTAFWVSFVLLVFAYFFFASLCTTVKQRSWILTTLSSAIMSLSSLPLVVQLACARGQLQLQQPSIPPVVTDSVCRFFQAYLIADLTMGMLFYRSKVNLLTGWIHHSVYIFVVEYAVQSHWSYIFCLCAIMEVPTFVLALGSITPRLRSDAVFALSFFMTRISFHIALCAALVIQRHNVTGGSLGPAVVMACIFPLHVHWFTGCVKGMLKRTNATGKSVPASKLPVNTILPPERPITPRISAPVSLHASRASLARRRTALRMAVRARWDQLKLWKASGRLDDMQRRVRAALPGRERVYQYVGLEPSQYYVSYAPSEQGLEHLREEASSSPFA